MKALSAVLLPAALLAIALLSLPTNARAGGLVECNNCASPRDAALPSGAGLTVVMDFERARLTAFNVEYDREFRKWRALPTPVPNQIQMAFLRIVDGTSKTPDQGAERAAWRRQPHVL